MSGRPVPLQTVSEHSKAILQTWHAGSEAGNAIADILFGDHSPTGKLPVSFPYHGGQEPLYYSRKSTGRQFDLQGNVFWSHYTDGPNEALYPFGHGLSYTTFDYANLSVSQSGEEVNVSFDLTNTGDRDGTEVAQLYIRDKAASIIRPIKELKRFQKLEVAQGETKAMAFTLTKEDLSFYNNEGVQVFEPGAFEFMVGGSSVDLLIQELRVE